MEVRDIKMAFYYDEVNEEGEIVARKVRLLPTTPPLTPGHRWVPWEPTLGEEKQIKRERINRDRTYQCVATIAAEVNGVSYNWQADERSQQMILASIVLASVGVVDVPAVWRTEDNINVPVTLQDLKNIARAMFLQTNNAFLKSWTLKAMLEQATSISEVESIQW